MRRSGVSLKVSDSSITCAICRSNSHKSCCFICKRQLCENCIDDNGEYCLYCSHKVTSSNETVIRVPTKLGSTNFIAIKRKSCCCLM